MLLQLCQKNWTAVRKIESQTKYASSRAYNSCCFSFGQFISKQRKGLFEIQLTRKLISDHFISSALSLEEFGENVLPLLSHRLVNSVDSVTDIIKLGAKLINAALSCTLMDIDWKTLESEVHPLASIELELWTSHPFLLCIRPCIEKPIQELIVFQKQAGDLEVSLLVQKTLILRLNVGSQGSQGWLQPGRTIKD